MKQSTQLGTDLQTTCTHCGSRFRITPEQLEVARGQVRCNQCMQAFNALLHLENFDPDAPARVASGTVTPSLVEPGDAAEILKDEMETQPVSLSEAMYGNQGVNSPSSIRALFWTIGILLMIIASIVQLIYYQRYSLIASPNYQQQILNLCQLLPCDRDRFSSRGQIRMLERNVFSHPTHDGALMVTGSFTNDAPFSQAMPELLISLSDLGGNLIANRLFTPAEYLTDAAIKRMTPGKAVQFKLEIFDPGTEALTYEFEFI